MRTWTIGDLQAAIANLDPTTKLRVTCVDDIVEGARLDFEVCGLDSSEEGRVIWLEATICE